MWSISKDKTIGLLQMSTSLVSVYVQGYRLTHTMWWCWIDGPAHIKTGNMHTYIIMSFIVSQAWHSGLYMDHSSREWVFFSAVVCPWLLLVSLFCSHWQMNDVVLLSFSSWTCVLCLGRLLPTEMDFFMCLCFCTACVNCVRWSNQGKYLASGSDDNDVMIWRCRWGFYHWTRLFSAVYACKFVNQQAAIDLSNVCIGVLSFVHFHA